MIELDSSISAEMMEELFAKSPRRRRFLDNPVVHPKDDGTAKFSVQKIPSVAVLFEEETGLNLREGPYGYYETFASPDAKTAAKWQTRRKCYVFLRDYLDI